MFNSTHTLTGLCLARAGLDRLAPHAVWTAVIAANLPDIDILVDLRGAPDYIAYHRGITHSIVGIPALALLLAAVMHAIAKGFRGHFIVALAVMFTHPALDYANTYGVRPLLPFDSRWIYGDALFVIDPFVDLVLAAGLAAGAYFRRRRLAAAISLAIMTGYVASRFELRNMARQRLESYAANTPGYVKSGVSPRMAPSQWMGVVETRDAVFCVELNSFGGVGREILRMAKGPATPAVAAARNTRTGAVFFDFSRFPVTRVHSIPDGYRVQFLDLRFYRSGFAFGAVIDLDPSLRVLRETMGFGLRVQQDGDL